MTTPWGLDLGTTNSGIARWDRDKRQPVLVELRNVCRYPDAPASAALRAPRMVPSGVHVLPLDLKARLGRLPVVRDAVFLGDEGLIGRPALEANAAWPSRAWCPSFKAALGREPLRTVAWRDAEPLSAREVARIFLRELFDEVAQGTGERVRSLAVTVPIEAFEGYRAELRAIASALGVRTLRFVDEPVAAALGYGVALDRPRELLVVDLGGGTLHVVRVRLEPRGAEAGACEVRAKEGHAVGGTAVDRWLLEHAAERAGVPLAPDPHDDDEVLWQRLMLDEARRVKEAVHTAPDATFTFVAPEELGALRAKVRAPGSVVVTRDDLEALLERRGLTTLLDGAIDRATAGAEVDEVLLVGGSTLLPGVYGRIERRFGRDRVRAWQPFECVALGAAAFAAGDVLRNDFLVHDYALRTHDRTTGAPQHTIVVARGTPFPTAPDVWRRQLVPTCALGEPETHFKLVVVELGRANPDGVSFVRDENGALRTLRADEPAVLAVPLNEGDPTLGELDPPHEPGDRRPRLDVAFGVDEDRWLVATVTDLLTRRRLLDRAPVVRLL